MCIARSCGVGSVGDFLVLAGLAEWSSVSGSAGGSGCSGLLNSVIPFQSSDISRVDVGSLIAHESLIQESRSGMPKSSSSKIRVIRSGPKSSSAGPGSPRSKCGTNSRRRRLW